MPTIAIVDRVKVLVYGNDHGLPHFHALAAEYRAVIEIEAMEVIRGRLPRAKAAQGPGVGGTSSSGFAGSLAPCARRSACEEDPMKLLPRIVSADVVIHGVVKLVFDDGYEGVVDLRPIIARGRVFTYLQPPENFKRMQVEEYGHHIFWVDESGNEIDFGADSLRLDCERQANIHKLMTV